MENTPNIDTLKANVTAAAAELTRALHANSDETAIYYTVMKAVDDGALPAAISVNGGVQTRTAARLGINRATLRTYLSQRNITIQQPHKAA